MDMPSRTEIRVWLFTLDRSAILKKLDAIREAHGADNERDVRDFLNYERERQKPKIINGEVIGGKPIFPIGGRGLEPESGEVNLYNERRQSEVLL